MGENPSAEVLSMVALNPPVCEFGWIAPDFALPGTDGRNYSLESVRGPNGLLVMFLCNHCPYVQAVIDRLLRDCRELADKGIGSVAIMSNDTVAYPEDSFVNMQRWARASDFPFPYLFDASQQVARAYGAVCTPDFFGFNRHLALQYRGRLDASGRNPGPETLRRDLFEAMSQVASTGSGPAEQVPSIGCSIKWRE